MTIRPARETDLPQILAIYAPYILNTTYSFEYTVPTLSEFTDRFREITEKFPWLVWEEEGNVLGYAYGSAPFKRAAYQWCCEISIYLHESAQHRGVGRKLLEALEKILKDLGYRKVYAIITDENTNSIGFHQAMGYQQIAHLSGCGFKFSRVCGTIWMEKNWNLDNISSKPPILYPNFVKDNSFNL